MARARRRAHTGVMRALTATLASSVTAGLLLATAPVTMRMGSVWACQPAGATGRPVAELRPAPRAVTLATSKGGIHGC